MYEDIEKEYKRKLNLNWAKAVYILIIAENIIVTIWCGSNWLKQIICLTIVMVLTILFVYLIVANKMRLNKKIHILSNVKRLIEIKRERNWKNFFRILEDRNIKNEAQLREVMEYFKLKIPQKTNGNISTITWEICITILPILLACIHFKENGTLDLIVTSSLFSIALVGITFFIALIVTINIAKTLYIELFDKYDVCEYFVEMISWKLVSIQKENKGLDRVKLKK